MVTACLFHYCALINVGFLSQHHDQHLTGGHCEHAAGPQHGQVLEGSARDLRHPQARGPAYEKRGVPQASTDGRRGLLTLGTSL